MRTIKFRGKNKNINEWVYGDLVVVEDGMHNVVRAKIITHCFAKSFIGCDFDHYSISTLVKPETVGQFTGLVDKNGKEIYEGDIVKTKGNWGGVVTWNSRGYYYIKDKYYYDNEEPDLSPLGSLHCYERKQLEIIGNIHDNPELLKNND